MYGGGRARVHLDGEALMGSSEVAKILAVSQRQVARMARAGRLPVAHDDNVGHWFRIGDVIEMACREDRQAEDHEARTRNDEAHR